MPMSMFFIQRCQEKGPPLPVHPTPPVPEKKPPHPSKPPIPKHPPVTAAAISAVTAAQSSVKSSPIPTKITDYLFVLFDAGETNALLPVIQKIQQQNKKVLILALGASANLIPTGLKEALVDLANVNVRSKIDHTWPSSLGIRRKSITGITECIHATKVVAGVASEIQGQILEGYAKASDTFAYRDNITPEGTGNYFQQAAKVQDKAKTVLFPSEDAMNYFAKAIYKKILVGNSSNTVDLILDAIK